MAGALLASWAWTKIFGGRLELLAPTRRTPEQQRLAERLTTTRVARGRSAGYTAALADGRLIGPFNGFLRAPAVGERQLDWVEAISAEGLPAQLREVAILTVGAQWRASYVLYAHVRAGRAAGLSAEVVEVLAAGGTPAPLSDELLLVHRLVLALIREHDVPDELYAAALAALGERSLVVLVTLVGQHLATSALLTCFRVPAPE